MGEQIEYGDVKIPVFRQSIAEMYLALQPPQAIPYAVVPRDAEPKQIIEFFSAHRLQIEELQAKMRKRFAKSKSEKCTYQTGDIAYVMGRPFMIETCPLNVSRGAGKATRGRVTLKATADIDISLLKLFVMQQRNFDQAKTAFLSYARPLIMRNAEIMARACMEQIAPDEEMPQIRMRRVGNSFSAYKDGVLHVCETIVPYPIDCLAYAIWRELMPLSTLGEEETQAALCATIPGWERAAEILRTKAKPYSNQ